MTNDASPATRACGKPLVGCYPCRAAPAERTYQLPSIAAWTGIVSR